MEEIGGLKAAQKRIREPAAADSRIDWLLESSFLDIVVCERLGTTAEA